MRRLTVAASRKDEIVRKLRARRPWYHKIDLGHGVSTRFEDDEYDPVYDRTARKKLERLGAHMPEDLTGQTVLDVGCCNGLFSVFALERGAKSVVGIDDQPDYIDLSNLIIRDALECEDFEGVPLSVYEYRPANRFDHVILYGVLYHLLDPYYVLYRLRSMVGGTLYLHTYLYSEAGEEHLTKLLYTPHLRAYNNLVHGINVIRAMLDYIGFDIGQEEVADDQVYLTATLRPDYSPPKYAFAERRP